MQKVTIYFLAMMFVVIFSKTYAAESKSDDYLKKECFNQKCAKAQGNVWLRNSPPSGLFYTKGEKTGVINKDEIVVVEDTKKVKTLFNTYEWLKVKRIPKEGEKATSNEPSTGWVYNGDVGDTQYFKEKKFIE